MLVNADLSKRNSEEKTLLDYYNEFEQKILRRVFQDTYSKNLKTYDLINHLDHIAADRNLAESPAYWSTRAALKEFSGQHRALINGSVGERRACNAIKHASVKKRILTNVRLERDGEEVEIDCVVITQAGIYCIEVKNYAHDLFVASDGSFKNQQGNSYNNYNIGERMSANKYILSSILAERFEHGGDLALFGILLNASRSANITNSFPCINLCSLGNIATFIDSSSTGRESLGESLMDEIAECIASAAYMRSVSQPESFLLLEGRLDAFLAEVEISAHEEDEHFDEPSQKTKAGSPTEKQTRISPREACLCTCSFFVGVIGGFALLRAAR